MTTKKNTKLLKNFIKTLANTRRYRLIPNSGDMAMHVEDRHRYKLVNAMAHFAGLTRAKMDDMTDAEINMFVARTYGLSNKVTVTGKLAYYRFNNREHAAKFLTSHVLFN